MKNIFSKLSLLGFFAGILFSTSCTTPVEKLNPEATNVTVLEGVSLTELEKLQRIGTGSCEIGANARTHQSNIIACQNYLRNEAAKKNADYLVFTSTTKKGATTGSVEATFYKKRDIANIK